VVSHVAVVPTLASLLRRQWIFEFAVGTFCLAVSLLYHLSECLGEHFFLSELQWHRLDNIGAIAVFGGLFAYLCDVPPDDASYFGAHRNVHQPHRPLAHQLLQFATLFASVIVQERDPWNELYTVAPIVTFALMPLVSHAVQRRLPRYRWAMLFKGFGAVAAGAVFFALGLDDANDPCRVYHGLWHLLGGLGMWWLWQVVPPASSHPRRSMEKGARRPPPPPLPPLGTKPRQRLV
jgi:hypothetical protein